MTMPKFPLGRTLMTQGAQRVVNDPTDPRLTTRLLISLFDRHQAGDWGELDEEDRHANDCALKDDGRLLSAYTLPNGVKIWIITEWDRSVTTVLLPHEY